MTRRLLLTITACAVFSAAAQAAPDEDALGKAAGYPVAPKIALYTSEPYIVGSFSGMDTFRPHCTLAPAAQPTPLATAAPQINFTYRFKGAQFTLDDYMQRQRSTAVLIVHSGEIVAERYNYDRTPQMRMLSNSMSKTINALGIMKALEEGLINSLDDTAATYVPELKGTLYGETKIVDLMRMASGAKFTEDYSKTDDRFKFNHVAYTQGFIAAAKTVTERSDPPGVRFNYTSSQTAVLGLVLRGATHRTLCDYVDEKIWKPIGAQSEATWLLNPADGTEIAMGSFNATVRDYARLGMMMAHDGRVNGQQIISAEHIRDMTDAMRQPAAFRPRIMQWHGSTYSGYGLQTWLLPGTQRHFALYGIYGQAIFVDPDLDIVMVHTAVNKDASGDASETHMSAERDALFRGVVAHYGAW